MLNVAIAIVLALAIVLSILFSNFFWLSTGGFIILVFATYLYLRFSSARYYLLPTTAIHTILVCSNLMVIVPVSIVQAKRFSPGLPAIFEMMVFGTIVASIMIPGIILLFVGLVMLFVRAKSIKQKLAKTRN
jgi:hypothetical protein